MPQVVKWIFVDYERCSGCRSCEIECSYVHENTIWREVSRIRIIEPLPGVIVPVVCVQCTEKYCMKSCPYNAIYLDSEEIVHVNPEKCTGCGVCIKACPGNVPVIHPERNYALICDLCGGDPQCVKICNELGYNALKLVESDDISRDLYLKDVFEIAEEIKKSLYGI
ncbi:MAG: 4Fe-4S dicluster domain-containing protein [Euryarchaeota archaeon]|nr:4Fe-4S dicluster domain-containing protein [Euryarchaeota archaeon]